MSAPTQPTTNGKPNDTPAPQKSSTAAADVGWQFVPQYYTMMHDAPERLHCFYNKKSTFVHGVEGEEVAASLGQQAIHQKVLSLGLQNCKAFIHHIDTQPSSNGGILLQVIGEMSNAAGPWRKFTQTFFLAEQPNGYYVLNDIFRFLKEGDEEEEEDPTEETTQDEPTQEPTQEAEQENQAPAVQASTEPIKVPSEFLATAPVQDVAESKAVIEETAAPEELKEEPAPAVAEAPVEEQKKEEPKTEEPKKEEIVEEAPFVEETPAVEPEKEEKPAQQSQGGKPASGNASAGGRRQSPSRGKQSQSPAQSQPQPQTQTPAPAQSQTPPAAAAAAPPKPRTWASTAAAKPNAWGTALATKEALSSNPTTAASAVPAVKPGNAEKSAVVQQQQQQQQVKQAPGAQAGGQAKFPLVEAAKAVQTPICFVKLNNWQAQDSTEQITESELRRVLSKSAGCTPAEITKVEIVRDKACAFVEFAKVDAARRAIVASLATGQGGGGGIKTDSGHRIIVESRKEKSERKMGAVGGAAVGQPAQQAPAVAQGPVQGQQARRQGSGQGQNQNQNQNQQNQNQNRAGGNAVRGGRGGRTQGQAAQK